MLPIPLAVFDWRQPTAAVFAGASRQSLKQRPLCEGCGTAEALLKMNAGRILLRFDVTSSEPPSQGRDTIGDAIWNRIGGRLKCLKIGLRYPEEIGEPLLLPILIATKLPEISTVESVLLAEWNAFGVDLPAAKRAEVAAAESLGRVRYRAARNAATVEAPSKPSSAIPFGDGLP